MSGEAPWRGAILTSQQYCPGFCDICHELCISSITKTALSISSLSPVSHRVKRRKWCKIKDGNEKVRMDRNMSIGFCSARARAREIS